MKLLMIQLFVFIYVGSYSRIYCGNLICDDFYKHACSNWIKSNSKPNSEPYWNVYTETEHHINHDLQRILENSTFINIENERNLYYSCTQPNVDYVKEFRNLIHKLGGIEMTLYRRSDYNFLMHIIEVTKLLNIHPVLKFYVERNLIHIERGDFIFPEVFLEQPQVFIDELKVYRNWIEKTITFLDLDHITIKNYENFLSRLLRWINRNRVINIATLANEIVDFEIKLVELPTGKVVKRPKDIFGSNFIIKFLLEGISSDDNSITDVLINEVYFHALLNLIHQTPPRIISNYIIWAAIKDLSRDINSELRQLNFEVDRELMGITGDVPRETECIQQIIKYIGYDNLLLNYQKITNQNENEIITNVNSMSQQIKNTFVKLLQNNNWLTNQTKENFIKRIHDVRFEILRPNTSMDKKIPKNVNLTHNHLRNLIKLKAHSFENVLEELFLEKYKETEDLHWPNNIFDVNAFYNPKQNTIILPIGILQPPFYDSSQPLALNYGALGTLIGHELSHALDNLNKHNFKTEDYHSYMKRKNCIQSVYSSNGIDQDQGLKMNENVADFLGLRLSYFTFTRLYANDVMGEEKSELFFLNYAKIWCELPSIEDTNLLMLDEHSPVAIRVNATLRHFNAFQNIFNCRNVQDDNDMKCVLW